MGVLLVKLGALAYTEDGNDSDDKGDKDGSGDIEDCHGDKEELEDVFDGVENVDKGRGGH